MMQIKFRVTGMTCAACSARVEKVTAQVTGVKKVDVNLLAGKMDVDAESNEVINEIFIAVKKAGYGISLQGDHTVEVKAEVSSQDEMKKRIVWSGFFLVILMYFTMGHMIGLPLPTWYHGQENAVSAALLQLLLTLPVVFLNRSYYTRGIKSLWNRAPNMDSLIAVGSGSALIYGIITLLEMSYAMGHSDWDTVNKCSGNLYFESAAMILTLITVGKFLETRAKGKTGDAIRQLMDLRPKTAFVRHNGELQEIAVENVKVGDTVVVRSGGQIPVDGTVVGGRASVDQSALTGESIPVELSVDDIVRAATIVTEGYIEIRADKTGEDTTLAQVIRMVEEAGGSKAPIARLADKIAGIFVPVVIGIALITFSIWMIAGQTFSFSLTTAIAVLVISCPCALGLATPVAIMVGTGRAANLGVLFKNAEALENLHNIDTVVLDKTGTLTKGKPAVTDIIPAEYDSMQLLKIAAALESKSEHPFAKAIMEKVAQEKCDFPVVEWFESLPGKGVCGIIDTVKFYGGNKQLMMSLGILVPSFEDYSDQGKTPLYFANDNGCYLGAILAADTLREDSADAVSALKKLHLDVIMLTGDNAATARAIGEKAGITNVISDVLPGEKASVIRRLQESGKNVLMVGDGINDAPALVTANVGMSIASGTDIAIESADVVLMQQSLFGVTKAFEISKATIRNIRQNLFWAFFYNCLGIPVAAGALYPVFQIQLSPMLGAAAMSLSSVFVVSNALRLRLFKPKFAHEIEKKQDIDSDNKEESIMNTTVIKVEGMMCPHCKARVESACKGVEGTLDAIVNLEAKEVAVTGSASKESVIKAITDAGYEVMG